MFGLWVEKIKAVHEIGLYEMVRHRLFVLMATFSLLFSVLLGISALQPPPQTKQGLCAGLAFPQVSAYSNETYHKGSLVVERSNVAVISDCRFIQVGDIVVRESGTLVIRNAELMLNQSHSYEFTILIEDHATLIVEDSTLLSNYVFEVRITELTTSQIVDSDIRGRLTCDGGDTTVLSSMVSEVLCRDGAKLHLVGTTASVSCKGGDLYIEDSQVPLMTLDLWDARAILMDLEPGHIDHWKLRENNLVWWAYPRITIENSDIGGWGVEVGGTSDVSVRSSQLSVLGVHFTDGINVSMERLPTGQVDRWNLLEDAEVNMILLKLNVEDSTIQNPWKIGCWDFSHVYVSDSQLSSLECHGFSNVSLLRVQVSGRVFCEDESNIDMVDCSLGQLLLIEFSHAELYGCTVLEDAESLGSSVLELEASKVLGDFRSFGDCRLNLLRSSIAGRASYHGRCTASMVDTPAEGGVYVYDDATALLRWFLNITVTAEFEPASNALVEVYYVHNSSLAGRAIADQNGRANFVLTEKILYSGGMDYTGNYLIRASYGKMVREKQFTLSASTELSLELLLRSLDVRCISGDEEPLEGVYLELIDAEGRCVATASSASNGWATLARVVAGRYTLRAYWQGVEVASSEVDLRDDVIIDPLPCRVYDFTVHVVDEVNKGIYGATVKLFWPNGTLITSAVTGAGGYIRCDDMPGGTYIIKASSWTFTAEAEIELNSEDQEVRLVLTSPIPVPLSYMPVFIAGVLALTVGSGLGWRYWRATKLKPKAREEMLRIIPERGWVNLKRLSKESVLSEKEIRRLIEKALAEGVFQGYFGKNKKSFITVEALRQMLRNELRRALGR